MLAAVAACAAACSSEHVGTSLRIALAYPAETGLDTIEVTLQDRTESAPIAPELLLLVPDELAGMTVPLEVWGRSAGKRVAYGTANAVPARGKTINVALQLFACSPRCDGDQLISCTATGFMGTCPLGCVDGDAPRCAAPTPSNGVDPGAAGALHTSVTISADATFDTDTGEITGGLARAAGTGSAGGVVYLQADPTMAGGAPLGIFVFHDLSVDDGVTVRFTGSRAAVVLLAETGFLGGVIDVAAGHGARSSPGPGGGTGGTEGSEAQGCGRGAPGTHTGPNLDGGGGGAGGSTTGGPGGGPLPGLEGVGGDACMPMMLEPLQGGSGGGRGSPGGAATAASGGGGGGAIQITSLGILTVTGSILAGGAGADGGPASTIDAGGGGGGGGGGAILLEAPVMNVGKMARLIANGGGGGGGATEPGATSSLAGTPGEDAGTSFGPVQGGGGDGNGGSGGAEGSPPDVGTGMINGGGGGGAAGVIVIRGRSRIVEGTISPRALQADIKPPT